MQSKLRSFGVLLVVVMTWASPAVGEIPAGPDAYTQADYRDDLLAFNRHAFVETYKQRGDRDPRWDALMLEFLEHKAIDFTNTTIDKSHLKLPNQSEEWDANRQEELQKLGCTEPLHLYLYAQTLYRKKERDAAREMARQAYEGMVERGYTPFRTAMAANRLYGYLPTGPEKDRMLEQHYRHMEEALLTKEEDRFGKRVVVDWGNPDSSWTRIQRYHEAAQRMPEDQRDPWAYHLICGMYHIKAAWQARGSGWASTVTDEGWQGFGEHLDQAGDHLKRAWAIEPRFPEPAAEMITVCMGGRGGPGDSEQLWFNRAVSAQLDYMPAYNDLQWALRPRWGGSFEEMLDHARQCVDTGRFDTEVPSELLDVLRDIADDSDGQWVFARDPDVWALVERLFEGMLTEPARTDSLDYWRSYYAVSAWRFGQYGTAKRMLDEVGENLQDRMAHWVSGSIDRVQDQTAAMTGAAAATFAAGDAAILRGDTAAAREHYEQARATPGLDPLSRRYAEHRLQQFRWQDRLERGEAISLVPDQDLQPIEQQTLAGLNVERGRWNAIDQTLIAESDGQGVEARLANPIGPRWRLAVTIDFGMNKRANRLAAGVITYWESYKTNHQFLLRPGSGHRYAKDWSTTSWTEADVPEVVEVVVEQWDDRRAMFMNGQLMRHSNVHHDHPYPSIGLGTPSQSRDTVIVFEKPTVQRLTTPPAWLSEVPEE